MSDYLKNLEIAMNNAKRLSNKILIEGKLSSPQTSKRIEVINPSTGEKIGEAPQCDKTDVNEAVISADNAFQKWKKIPARERGKMMIAAARKIEEKKKWGWNFISFGYR